MSEDKTYTEIHGELDSSIKEELRDELKDLETKNEKDTLDEFSDEKLKAALAYVEKHRPNTYKPKAKDLRETRPSLEDLRTKFRSIAAEFDDEEFILKSVDIDKIFCRKTLDQLCDKLIHEQKRPLYDLDRYLNGREKVMKELAMAIDPKQAKEYFTKGWKVIVDRYKSDPEDPIGQRIIEEEKEKEQKDG